VKRIIQSHHKTPSQTKKAAYQDIKNQPKKTMSHQMCKDSLHYF
jgi:hypothetical protein